MQPGHGGVGRGRGKGELGEALSGPFLHPASQPSLSACVQTLCWLPGRAGPALLGASV